MMSISIAPPKMFAATLVLLSGALISLSALANYSPLEELKKVGFYGRVHPWKNITRKAHSIKVNVPKNAPVIVSDYHSPVGANGLKRTGTHNGIDIFGEIGSPIIAAADGYVVKAKVDRCWGPTILMSHGIDERGKAIYALYGHVKNFKVKVGERVARGQQIAEMGDDIYTGCGAGFHHLHFQISYNPQEIPLLGWGWSSFVADGKKAPNPHKFWADGEGKITCFEAGKRYDRLGFTYPVPCKNTPQKAKPTVAVVAQSTQAPKPINHPSIQELDNFDGIEREFSHAAAIFGFSEKK